MAGDTAGRSRIYATKEDVQEAVKDIKKMNEGFLDRVDKMSKKISGVDFSDRLDKIETSLHEFQTGMTDYFGVMKDFFENHMVEDEEPGESEESEGDSSNTAEKILSIADNLSNMIYYGFKERIDKKREGDGG